MNPKTLQEMIDKINKQYPPHTIPIKYKDADGSTQEAKVRFPPEILESGRAVIWLEGVLDAVELKNVIIDNPEEKK